MSTDEGVEMDVREDIEAVLSFWKVIQSAVCCKRWNTESSSITGIASESVILELSEVETSGNSVFQKVVEGTRINVVDADTRRRLHLQRLKTLLGHSKGELNSTKSDSRLLDIPSQSGTTQRSKKNGDVHIPKCHEKKSTWDSFFESRSDIQLTMRTDNTTFTYDVNQLGDGTDWIESDDSLPEIPVGTNNIEDRKWTRNEHKFGESWTTLTAVPAEYSRRRGEVLLSCMSKNGMRYTFVPMDIRIEEVAVWLNKGSGTEYKIPISDHVQECCFRRLNLKRINKFSKGTLSELFGDSFDPEKNGITFFVGPVEGVIKFKMSVCELQSLQLATRDSIASPIKLESK